MGAPRYLKLVATNAELYVAVFTVACFFEYQSTGVLLTK